MVSFRTLQLQPVWIGLAVIVACSEDGGIQDGMQPQPRSVTVVFSPDGLGDNGYNDLILRGVLRFAEAHADVATRLCMPETLDEARLIAVGWCRDGEEGCSLLVLAASDYVEFARDELGVLPLDSSRRQILLFESGRLDSVPVSTFMVSTYGAAWMAGVCAAQVAQNPLVVLANERDPVLKRSYDGFADGFRFALGDESQVADYVCLSAGNDGFAMENEAYRQMGEWAKQYDFVFPVAGGSNMGIYRYLREYPYGRIYTAGMDVDQSILCNNIVGSVEKSMDRIVEQYLEDWAAGTPLPKYRRFGWNDGGSDWQISTNFQEFFGEWPDNFRAMARQEEEAYENRIVH